MTGKITFIGAGNMASSIIGGLIGRGTPADSICAADALPAALERAARDFAVMTATDNAQAVRDASVVVLAVKPDVMHPVCSEIADTLTTETLLISIAAGVRAGDIQRWLGKAVPIVRCMPNTPALLNLGANALFANSLCGAAHRSQAEQLLSTTGIVRWLDDESQIDTVTALSGSGPAYFFHLIECMTAAAVEMGLSADVAETLAIETAYGAAAMAREKQHSPARLRENVTSKGGTTAAALETFADAGFSTMVTKAMAAARSRARTLGDELGNADDASGSRGE